jgi:outer membrane protein assembly factor BamB
MKSAQRRFKLFLATLILFSLCAGGLYFLLRQPQRRILESTPALTEIWMLPGVKIERLVNPYLSFYYLMVHNNHAIFLGRRFLEPPQLQSLYLFNGDVLWQAGIPASIHGRPWAIVSNARFIYIGFLDSPAEGYQFEERGSVRLAAYDIESGDLVWNRVYQGLAIITSISATGQEEVTFGGGFGHTGVPVEYTIDAQTGDVISYHIMGLSASQLHSLPLSLDREVVSNIALSKGILFFLTEDALLWAVDEDTGEILGSVQFTPNNLRFNVPYDHHVAATSEFVIVYLGDSRQLFAFRFSPEPG